MADTLDFSRIRAHHLLCIQGFQGYGYNRNFVANMLRILKDINPNSDLEIEIIDECDVICSQCPHNKEEICQKNPDSALKVKCKDERVLRRLGLRKGISGRARDIFSLVNKKLKNIPDVQDICGDCDWKEKCLWFMRLKKM